MRSRFPENYKAWFAYGRPDRRSRLKKCSDDRDDHMETTIADDCDDPIKWIELISIRTTGTFLRRFTVVSIQSSFDISRFDTN